MPVMDSILCTVQANNNTVNGVATMGTSLAIRNGWGAARIVGGMAFGDTDDITRAVVTCPSWSDANGVSLPVVSMVAAEAAAFDLDQCRFDVPIEVQPSDLLNVAFTSETAANTQCYALLYVEYMDAGVKWDRAGVGMKSVVTRNFTAIGALVSNTEAVQTALTSLAANKRYQMIGVRCNGISTGAAGIVGPAFIKFRAGPGEFGGANVILPLPHGIDQSGPTIISLVKCGFLTPTFQGGQNIDYSLLGFTAETPQGELLFACDKV